MVSLLRNPDPDPASAGNALSTAHHSCSQNPPISPGFTTLHPLPCQPIAPHGSSTTRIPAIKPPVTAAALPLPITPNHSSSFCALQAPSLHSSTSLTSVLRPRTITTLPIMEYLSIRIVGIRWYNSCQFKSRHRAASRDAVRTNSSAAKLSSPTMAPHLAADHLNTLT